MNVLTGLLPFILIFLIMYLLIILPDRRRRKKLQELINSLKVGDKIVTTGGIHGTVLSLRDDRLIIKSDQARLEIARAAVAGLQAEPGQESASDRSR